MFQPSYENILQHFTHQEIVNMASRYRAHLINSLSGFKSANLIGTVDNKGHTNLAIFSSVVHLGASPALVGFIMRPNSVERHTLNNIEQTKQYTINQVGIEFWQAAHQTSARYADNECEFNQTGLTPTFIDELAAPFIAESQLKYALTLKEIIPIAANNTLFIIGEITDLFCQQSAIKNDGYIDIATLGAVSISGLDSYHTSERLSRLSYAKPYELPKKISLDGDIVNKAR